MKNFVFISDFDGTLSKKDFYLIIIDKYLKERGTELYKEWKKNNLTDFDFLNMIFSSINKSEDEIYHDILDIPIDENAKDFIEHIKASGGDFVILSAGTSYYIEKLLAHKKITDCTIISNKGEYKNGGIHMLRDESNVFYSKRYGIDKAKVVKYFKTKYKTVFYAGDSEPDLEASQLADVTFATGQLVNMLSSRKHPFVKFDNFKEIETYIKDKGVKI